MQLKLNVRASKCRVIGVYLGIGKQHTSIFDEIFGNFKRKLILE